MEERELDGADRADAYGQEEPFEIDDSVQPKGRLELTWTNKDKALLATEDGRYQWVKPKDHRVAEVRLLRDAGEVGEVGSDEERAKDNLLIRGDALNALEALTKLPEFADELLGQVKLIYIDPPFNTGQAFEHYDDSLEHSVWLTMMRDRLQQAQDLLHPEGTIWVHLDDSEMAYCKALLDETMGRDSFVATVVWQRRYIGSSDTSISPTHDYLLVYAKDALRFKVARNLLARSPEQLKAYKNPDDDPRGPWRIDNYTQNHSADDRPGGFYAITRPADGEKIWPRREKVWRYTQEAHARNEADNRVWWGEDGMGTRPYYKRFLSEVAEGMVPQTWWPHDEVGHNKEATYHIKELFPNTEPFATPKPERLLSRIVHISSNPGDTVLDFFGGSGTTAAVAHKMGRRWVTVERGQDTIDNFLAPRLKKVVDGDDPGGISEAQSWKGGGGFRVLDVAPSMYEEDAGMVLLADWAVKSALAEATAAQLGFDYEEDVPFCGRKGRMRLAVVDGHCDERVVRELVKALGKGEKLAVCATSLDPQAGELLGRLKSGSQARVIPEDVLLSYRTPSAWRVSVARTLPSDGAVLGNPFGDVPSVRLGAEADPAEADTGEAA